MSRFFLCSLLSTAVFISPSFARDMKHDILNHPSSHEKGHIKLDLSGDFYGYISVVNQDTAAGQSVRSVDILRDTEIEFNGETELNNGTSVGIAIEVDAQAGRSFDISKSYIFGYGTWGRVDFGTSDGAVQLLQIEAPSADEVVDGADPKIQSVNYNASGVNAALIRPLRDTGYINEFTEDSDKITYLTPVFEGTQIGVSYTPNLSDTSRGLNGNNLDNQEGVLGDAWEIGYRYERDISSFFGFKLGAGYTHVNLQRQNDGVAPAAIGDFTDDFVESNIGLDMNFGAFGLGAIYTQNNSGLAQNGDVKTWVLGADYALTDDVTLGASYLNRSRELGVVGSSDTLDTDRYTIGVAYKYGSGVTFNGSVQQIYNDTPLAAGAGDVDATSFLLGTKIAF